MKKVLVTGAGGFAGGHVANYLFQCGYDVIGTIHRGKCLYDFPVVTCDLTNEIDIKGDFDIIVHAAGGVPHRNKNFNEFKRSNVDTMGSVLRYAVNKNVPRIIYLSTIGVYGEFRDSSIDETADRINQDDYGLTKYMAECMLRGVSGIENISLRMPGIIGKGSYGIWFTNIVERFRRGETVTIYAPDFQTKNFVWIEDLSRFIKTLIELTNWRYDVVNLACSESATIREIVLAIKKLTDSSSQIVVDESIREPFCLDNKRAVEMGYSSLAPLEIVQHFLAV